MGANTSQYLPPEQLKHSDRIIEVSRKTVSSPFGYFVLMQVMMIMLPQLKDSYLYLQSSEHACKSILDHHAFVDVFGHLVDDADLHFGDFRSTEVATCDPMEVFCILGLLCSASARDKCEFLVSIHVDSRSKRLKGTGLFLLLRRITSGLHRVFGTPLMDNIALGAYVNTLISSYVDRNLFNLSNDCGGSGQEDGKVNTEDKESPWAYLVTNTSIRFTFEEIYQFLQDTTDTCQFMDHWEVFCSTCLAKNERWRAKNPVIALKDLLVAEVAKEQKQFSKLRELTTKSNPAVYQSCLARPRSSLWSYNVTGMMRESWFAPVPTINSDDLVYTALEHIILSDRTALPVFLEPKVPTSFNHTPKSILRKQAGGGKGGGGESSVFFPAEPRGTSSVGSSGFKASVVKPAGDNSSRGGSQFPYGSKTPRSQGITALATSAVYYGIVDLGTVLAWIAANCPDSLVSKVAADEAKRKERSQRDMEAHLLLTRGSTHNVNMHRKASNFMNGDCNNQSINNPSSERSGSTIRNMLSQGQSITPHGSRSSSTISIPNLGAIGRQESGGRGGATHWQATGERIAASSIHDALTILNNRTNPIHVGGASGSCPILQPDQFLYDLIFCVAQGHRNIPIAFQEDRPNIPSYIITDIEVVSFLCENAIEILGSLAKVQIKNCEFMRNAVCIPSTSNFGCALYTLACRQVDAAVILDNSGKFGGRFSIDVVKNIWFEWKKQVTSDPNSGSVTAPSALTNSVPRLSNHSSAVDQNSHDSLSLEELKIQYRDNKEYEVFDGTSGNVFSMYSCLLRPLKSCQDFGVKVTNFDHFINAEVHTDSESNRSDTDSDSSSEGPSSP
jgi:hypothetical protein